MPAIVAGFFFPALMVRHRHRFPGWDRWGSAPAVPHGHDSATLRPWKAMGASRFPRFTPWLMPWLAPGSSQNARWRALGVWGWGTLPSSPFIASLALPRPFRREVGFTIPPATHF